MPIEAQFDPDVYHETSAKIGFLKAQLPEAELRLVAKEVLERVSARYRASALKLQSKPDEAEINKLVFALVSQEASAGLLAVTKLRDAGVTKQDVYLSYLAVASARMGEMWDNDQLSLVDVGLGTSRILGILRALGRNEVESRRDRQRKSMFVATPGETHTLGINMAADLFKTNGWDIEMLVGLSHEDIVSKIEQADCPIIGLSAGASHTAAALARLVLAIRVCNPDALIMISGRMLDERQEMVEAMLPDAIARDVPEALKVMENLWQSQKSDQAAV